jgi:asparaginyl-tRNA synthetase
MMMKKTVRAMDVYFPGIGEIIGGSQREERLDILQKRINEMGIDEKRVMVVLRSKKIWDSST